MCQKALLVLGIALFSLNLFILFVAFVTSGNSLISNSSAWYAALAPILSFAYAIVLGSVAHPRRGLLLAGAFVFAISLPAIWHSFMHIGWSIPILILWWLCVAFEGSGAPHESK